MNDLFEEEETTFKDQTQYSWHDPLWLQANKLTEDNCLDYFMNSIFYDKSPYVIFKVAKVNIPGGDDMGFRITKLTSDPNPSHQKMISMYFIVEGIIFQAATLKAIIEERLERASY